MKNRVINSKRKILIVLLIFLLITGSLLYGINKASGRFWKRENNAALAAWEIRFPNSMSNINEKFGNDLEVVSVSRGSISIIYKNSTWFENKYNVSGKSDAEFLKDIADEWFECFRDEISAELEKEDTYFRWPVVISFKLEPGNEYEMLTFRFDGFDECTVLRHEKY